MPIFNLLRQSSGIVARDVKGTEQWSDGVTGVQLDQFGSCGSALPCQPSKIICSMEGLDRSNAAPRMKELKAFQVLAGTLQPEFQALDPLSLTSSTLALRESVLTFLS